MVNSDFIRSDLIVFSNVVRSVNYTLTKQLLILIYIMIAHEITGIHLVSIVYHNIYR